MKEDSQTKKLPEAMTASAFGGEARLRMSKNLVPNIRSWKQPSTLIQEEGEQTKTEVPNERNRSISIRQSGSKLPFQFFWDWLSGVPLQQPHMWFRRTPLMHVIDSVGGLFAATALGYVALTLKGWWLLLLIVALPLILGRARKCHMTIVHQAVHDQLFQSKKRQRRQLANRLVAEVIGILIWIPDFQTYRKAHAISHHNPEETATPKDLDGKIVFTIRYGDLWGGIEDYADGDGDTATTRDIDGKEVFKLGFVPGMPRQYYWKLLLRIVASPWFYISDVYQRIYFSLFKAPWYRRVASSLFLVLAAILCWYSSSWVTLVVLYFIPVFPLFKLSGLLQQLSEHMWGTHMDLIGSRERLPLVCQGRYLFDQVPEPQLAWDDRVRATIIWWVRVPYHLLVRVCILGGDLQAHHDHHFHPRALEWTSASHACLARMRADKDHKYTHAWSLGEALDRVFTAMSVAPPLEQKWLDELK